MSLQRRSVLHIGRWLTSDHLEIGFIELLATVIRSQTADNVVDTVAVALCSRARDASRIAGPSCRRPDSVRANAHLQGTRGQVCLHH